MGWAALERPRSLGYISGWSTAESSYMNESEHYHAGELEVQDRAGAGRQAGTIGEMILPFIPPATGGFVSAQRLAVVGSVGSDGRVWASAMIGDPGFLSIPDERTLWIVSPEWEKLSGRNNKRSGFRERRGY